MYLLFDVETRSLVDLKAVGAWVYSEDESTDLICMAWAHIDRAGQVTRGTWVPGDPVPEPFFVADRFVARNAFFEWSLYQNVMRPRYGFPNRPDDIWIDTAMLSRAVGLPGSLAGSAEALKIPGKLDEGDALIRRYSRPFKGKLRPLPKSDLDAFIRYNEQDATADFEVFERVRGVQNNIVEQGIQATAWRHNLHGLRVDVPLVDAMIKRLDEMSERVRLTVPEALNVASPRQLAEFCASHGVVVPNAQKATIEDILSRGGLPPEVETVLTARLLLSKASTKKYQAIKDRTGRDGRLRDFLLYYGAHTGRFSGRGFQPHNLPKVKNDLPFEEVRRRAMETVDPVEFNALAQALVPMVIRPDSGVFLAGDFAAIEARGTAWLAGEESMLEAFRTGRDVYLDMAHRVNGTRQLGKQIILGCTYGMGAPTFLATCLKYRIDIAPSKAEHAVNMYRATYPRIVSFWHNLFRAFSLVARTGAPETVGRLRLERSGSTVTILLPSGRRLYYHRVKVDGGEISFSNLARGYITSLWHGILVENVVQAMCRDILTDRILELERVGLPVRLHVHDEVVVESTPDRLEDFSRIMNTQPTWAPGFPLTTECLVMERYHK